MNVTVWPRRVIVPASGEGSPAAARLPASVVLALILAGGLQRWWAAAHAIGTLSSDGAVIGLMALRLLHHGQLTAYMWGQSYGGSLEAVAAAAAFAVSGAGTSQLLATTALSSGLCALALWWAGRPIVGERAAQLGALMFWVWPASFLWRSIKPGGTYMIGLAIALCAVGALARIRRGQASWDWCALAGALCGLALWSSPMSLELLVPTGLWLVPALRRAGWRALALAGGAITGGLPLLVFGATHDWTNLHMPGYNADLLTGVLSRLRQFFPVEAPIAMGVRVEGSLAWVGGYLGMVLAVAAAVALLGVARAVLAGRAPRCVLPVLTLAALPALYALNPLADNIGQGRYALFAVPMAALLLGLGCEQAGLLAQRRAAARARPGQPQSLTLRHQLVPRLAWTAGLALACALGSAGLAEEPGRVLTAYPAPDVPMPASDSALRTLLADHDITHAYAPYWMAYRITFETGGRTLATPYDFDRYPPIAGAVQASPHPAYLFVSASGTVSSFEAWCRGHGLRYQAWHLGAFTVVQPAASVRPAAVPHAAVF
ncbi:MAG TPA: hypothetical protein VMG38_24695 [Trebonia sp.]|nr:hypothetical protein [Trebonia sp.]